MGVAGWLQLCNKEEGLGVEEVTAASCGHCAMCTYARGHVPSILLRGYIAKSLVTKEVLLAIAILVLLYKSPQAL